MNKRKPYNYWSKDEISWFVQNYPSLGAAKCAEKLNRPVNRVRDKASFLKVKFNRPKATDESHKICAKCKNEKLISDFNKSKLTKDKLQIHCRECSKAYAKQYIKINKEKLKIKQQEYHRKAYYKNREENIERSKKYHYANKEKILLKKREYYKKNKDKLSERSKKYRSLKENKEKRNEQIRNRTKSDINFKLKQSLSARLREILKCNKKDKTIKLIGCSINQLKTYLESQFEPGMTWENHGKTGFNIDHIIPCDMFDLTKEEEQMKCFNYTNLMPRWATTKIALEHGSRQIGNHDKNNKLIDTSYYKFLENPS